MTYIFISTPSTSNSMLMISHILIIPPYPSFSLPLPPQPRHMLTPYFLLIYDVRTHVQLSYSYRKEATRLKRSVLDQLWDEKDKFFKVLTYVSSAQAAKGVKNVLVDVRELHGYTPWYSHTTKFGCVLLLQDHIFKTLFLS